MEDAAGAADRFNIVTKVSTADLVDLSGPALSSGPNTLYVV